MSSAIGSGDPSGSLPPASPRCDLCESVQRATVLESPGLQGPLVRCSGCGLYYVAAESGGLAYGTASAEATARGIEEANRRYRSLPRREERRLNRLNARWRLDLIRRYTQSGRLLEVGCGRGDFLSVAKDAFEVRGVEPNPDHAREAALEAEVFEGLIEDVPWEDFDVAASFHVLEHVASPSRFLKCVADRLKRGGIVAIETPDIGGWPYRVFGSRWRQFIPEHLWFFDQETMTRLLSRTGFELRHVSRVGKYASLALILNRLGRQLPLPGGLSDRTSRFEWPVDPGDIMLAIAVRR